MGAKKHCRIYGKLKSDKKFKLFDCSTGRLVDKIIDCTYYDISQKPKVEEAVAFLNRDNKDYVFEVRCF